MNAFWSYFWPAFGVGLAPGVVAGALAFRRIKGRFLRLAIGCLVAITAAMLWHGPFGAADRFAGIVEKSVRATLVYNEIPEVTGHLNHGPLTRQVTLSGPADDFQRSELVRIIGDVPGVSSATWDAASGGGLPLIVEGVAVALLGYLFGLLVAYLVELRRRYNAQWNW